MSCHTVLLTLCSNVAIVRNNFCGFIVLDADSVIPVCLHVRQIDLCLSHIQPCCNMFVGLVLTGLLCVLMI